MGKRQHDWKLDFGRVVLPRAGRPHRPDKVAWTYRLIDFSVEDFAYRELMQVHDEEKGDHEEND